MNEKSSQQDSLDEAFALIDALHEDQLQPEQAARLENWVCTRAEIRKLYVLYMHQRCVVATMAWPAASESDHVSMDDTMVLGAITGSPEPDEEILRLPSKVMAAQNEFEAAKRERARRLLGRSLWAAGILIAMSAAAFIYYHSVRSPQLAATSPVSHPDALSQPQPTSLPTEPPASPPIVFVATLSSQHQATWRDATDGHPVGTGFPEGTHLSLVTGLAELTLASGATAIVEAPSDFEVGANAILLSSGKLGARVPPPAHGFVVKTPQSTITDLGTEMGVSTDASGVTQVDVFEGKVTAQPRATTGPSVMLIQGKAASVSEKSVTLDPLGAIPQRFVRHLQIEENSLDAVDLVGGGDGTSHRRGAAIDPLSGKFGSFDVRGVVTSNSDYHRVEMSVIDGCFVPRGRMKVDSNGDEFDFGRGHGIAFDYIRAGGTIVWPRQNGDPQFTARLGDVDYGTGSHGFMLMHANAGITLDLSAVRRLCPEYSITSFRALVGNTANVPSNSTAANLPRADVVVLVDGKARFTRPDMTSRDTPASVDVSLEAGDRFLTLATIDHRNAVHFDWMIFADPALKLTKTAATAVPAPPVNK